MPGKWIANNPLSFHERELVEEGIKLNLSYSQIAKHVGRCKSVVMRESKRIGTPDEYTALKGQADFEEKQKLIGKKGMYYGNNKNGKQIKKMGYRKNKSNSIK